MTRARAYSTKAACRAAIKRGGLDRMTWEYWPADGGKWTARFQCVFAGDIAELKRRGWQAVPILPAHLSAKSEPLNLQPESSGQIV